MLTLVLGASLVGVSIDFPLHYLSKSWTLQPWHSHRALRLTLPGLFLALATFALGLAVENLLRGVSGLLGGLVVRVGSRMIDTSLRTRLMTIKTQLKEVG